MQPPRRFGTDHFDKPTREWAETWADRAPKYWALVLAGYRERVGEHYSRAHAEHPDAYSMASPVELRIIVSLVRAWVFVKQASEDLIWVDEHWEHPVLASLDMYHHPHTEQLAREVLSLGDEWSLVEDQAVSYFDEQPFEYSLQEKVARRDHGWKLADWDDGSLKTRLRLDDAIAQLRGRHVDRQALHDLEQVMQSLGQSVNPQRRGREFDRFMEELLQAHGCDVDRGRVQPSE